MEGQKEKELEMLLNIVTDLSAEAFVSIEENQTDTAKEQLGQIQSFVDAFMENNSLRQVTEVDGDFRNYMDNAYLTLDRK